MADEPQTPPATGDSAAPASAPPAPTADAALGPAGEKALAEERKARREAEKTAREAQARIEEFEARDLTEQQKLEKRAAEAEGKLAPTALENLRLRVALDKKVPAELIDRLKGSTKEEIETDADELLKLVKVAPPTSFDGGPRGNAPAGSMDDLIRQGAGRA